MSEPTLGIHWQYLSKGLENDVVKAYFQYMIDFVTAFSAEDKERVKRDLRASLDLEIKIAQVSLYMDA